MSIVKRFFNQTRKPEGPLGNMMLRSMNSGHARLADWGLLHLPEIDVDNAVDLGCGAGRNAAALLQKYPDAHISAVDYSPLSVEKSKQYNKDMILRGRCRVMLGDVSDLKLPDESFDLATAFETIYFWPGLEKCFSQVVRILKPGGYFMICNESDGTDFTGKRFEKIIDGMTCYTAPKIEEALKNSGFSEVTREHHPSKPWITLIARKNILMRK